ncbi:MAG: hypothetical protein KME55_36825 [Nostoc indistinguendum CM1-VF10]|jgi:hypothetical protein|nr:hypothetical protein [Nostoc indistinguendum CM1-VF10]
MNRHFHGTAAEGTWRWKDAYEAVEVAQILYLRQKGCKLFIRVATNSIIGIGEVSSPLPNAYSP